MGLVPADRGLPLAAGVPVHMVRCLPVCLSPGHRHRVPPPLVDDNILTASSPALLQQITSRLGTEFALKDMGALHYFLGIEVVRRATGFFLHQQKYAYELLERAGMLNCKPAPTLVDTKAKASAVEGSPASDAPFYRSFVGALQYLTLTRPDIHYTVRQVCLHMHAPRDTHWLW
nr:uncharacterized mitochondrial protein AtMg00810-like [Aegilops tauschii subsp. strangulata]